MVGNPSGAQEWPILALDVGGTWSRAGAVMSDGTVLSKMSERTHPERSGDEIVATCAHLVREVAAQCTLAITRVGVSVTGPVNRSTGAIYSPPNASGGLVGLELRSDLSIALGDIPVVVEKDTNAVAIAEQRFGAAQGVSNFVYITISTGIGGAIVIDGNLIGGADGCAGEIGHVSVDPNGPQCTCGRRGCLEAIASGPALATRLTEARFLSNGAHRELGISALEGVEVARLANCGDSLALEVMVSAGRAVASAAVDLANTFNPSLIVIGGSVAQANPNWLLEANEAIRSLALSPSRETTQVVASQLDDDGGLIGAALLLAKTA